MSDILERLQDRIHDSHMDAERLMDDAHDEIERLRAAMSQGEPVQRQLFVVDGLDAKSGKVNAVYVFDNHAAALECRRHLGLDHDHLRGCVIFSAWESGQPQRDFPSLPVSEPGGWQPIGLRYLEDLAKDCEECAADACNDGDKGLQRSWLSVAYRIRHAVKALPPAPSPLTTEGAN